MFSCWRQKVGPACRMMTCVPGLRKKTRALRTLLDRFDLPYLHIMYLLTYYVLWVCKFQFPSKLLARNRLIISTSIESLCYKELISSI